MSARIRIISVIYIFIFAGIVVLADVGQTQHFFSVLSILPFGDKVGHFCLIGLFSLFVNLALNAKSFQFRKLNYLLGSLIVLAVVTAEEFSQIFIPGRNFDVGDLISDYAGIFIFGETARLICWKIAAD
jgi:hypothetical protein